MESISPRGSVRKGSAGKLDAKPSPTMGKRKDSYLFRPSSSSQASKYSAVIESFKAAKEEDKDVFEDARVKIKKFLTNSRLGVMYDNIFLVISIISSLEFIYQTYLFDDIDEEKESIYYLRLIELGFAGCFAFDWSLNYFLADHKLKFILSPFSMIDILTIVSTYATFGQNQPDIHTDNNNAIDYILYILFGLRAVRILRSIHARKKFVNIRDAVDRYLLEISLSAIIVILFCTAVIHFLESKTQPNYLFHTWIYYIWVTLSTVGYGDITPQSTTGRFAAMALIGFAIVTVPKVTNELIEKMKMQTVYMRAVYTPRSRYGKHIVICGDISSTSLHDFFDELFHEDHENTDLNAVMLLPLAPSVDIIFLMRDPKYFLSLTYLEGSALIENDLKRSKAESAAAIFIMTNKFSTNPDEEDAKSILLTLSIKRYLSLFNRNTLFCMQLLRPENRRHLAKNDTNEIAENDLVVCLNEIKLGAIAKAVTYPGSNTLLMNLVSSFSDNAIELNASEEHEMSMSLEGESSRRIVSGSQAWFKEYEKGCGWEIYTTKLAKVFVGAKFCELSYALYNKFGVVLFALQIRDLVEGGNAKILLNPADFIIPNSKEYYIEAFVIAQNKASSDLSFSEDVSEGSALSVVNRNIGNLGNIIKSTVDQNPLDKRKGSTKEVNKIFPDGIESATETPEKQKPKISKWKQLKRSALLEAKVKSNNYQETLHKFEDEHFKRNYYLRSAPVDIAEITVKTNVMDEIPYINNHLIVVGKGLRNLYDLIRPLRAKYLGPLRHIVLLYPNDIPHDVWQRVSIFDEVIVVRGSPLEDSNLRRAGIFRAAQVVVLAEGDSSHSNMDALVDSEAIFAYQHVKRMNPNTHVVIEIINKNSISYVDEEMSALGIEDPKFSPQFAAGTLFTTSLLDSIICQAYYNPQIINVVHKLLSGIDQTERSDLVVKAAEEVFGDSGDEEAETTKAKAPVPEALKRAQSQGRLSLLKGSCLYQMNIPDNLEKKTYGCLFKYLSVQGIVPLGLLRGTLANINIGPKANKLPYVYTNPDKDAEVFSCDRVFVLSQKPERVAGKMEMKDWLLDLQMQSKQKDGTSNTPTSALKSMETAEKSHRKLEEKVHKLSVDVNKKMSNMMSMMEQLNNKIPSQSNMMYTLSPEDEQQVNVRHRMDSDVSYHNIYSTMNSRSDEGGGSFVPRSRFNTADTIHSEGSCESGTKGSSHSPSDAGGSVDRDRVQSNLSPPVMIGATGQSSSDRRVSVGSMSSTMGSPRGILKKGPSTTLASTADGTTANSSIKNRPSFSEPLVTILSNTCNDTSEDAIKSSINNAVTATNPAENTESKVADQNKLYNENDEKELRGQIVSTIDHENRNNGEDLAVLPVRNKPSNRPVTAPPSTSSAFSKAPVSESTGSSKASTPKSIFSSLPTTIAGPKLASVTQPISTDRAARLRSLQGSSNRLSNKNNNSGSSNPPEEPYESLLDSDDENEANQSEAL